MKSKSISGKISKIVGALLLCFMATSCPGISELQDPGAQDIYVSFLEDVAAGNLAKVKTAIAEGVDINIEDESGHSALHLSLIHNHGAVLDEILSTAGLDISKKGPGDTTALHYAVTYSLEGEIILKLLSFDGISVNSREAEGGASALIAAVQRVSTAVGLDSVGLNPVRLLIKTLIQWEATDLNLLDHKDKSALYYAARYNPDPEVIRALLSDTSRLDQKVLYDGVTALRVALLHNNVAVLEAFLEDVATRDAVNDEEEGETALVAAIRRGNVAILEALLRVSQLDINAVDSNGETALHAAIREGNVEVLQVLLETQNIEVNAANRNGERPLHAAIREGNVEALQVLLRAQNIDVNAANRDEDTPLHTAIREGNLEVLQALLETQNIEVNAANRNGETPLHTAIRRGNLDLLQALLDAQNIEVNAANRNGETPLQAAIRKGDLEALQVFKTNRPDILTTCVNGKTLLKILEEELLNNQKSFTDATGEAVKDYLKSVGVTLECTDAAVTQSAFHAAAQSGDLPTIRRGLLQTGADAIDVNAKANGETALHVAASNSLLEVVKALLDDPNIDVNAQGRGGDRPLHAAVWLAEHYGGRVAIVKALLDDPNIDVNAQNKYGSTALTAAAGQGYTAIVKELLKAPNIEVNLANNYGFTALHMVSRLANFYHGRTAILNALLATPDVNVNAKDRRGETPLDWAADGGHVAVVKTLLATPNIDLNVQDGSGQTPLYSVILRGHIAVVKVLLATPGVDVNIATNRGWTALQAATLYSNVRIIKELLLVPNIDVNAKNNYGWTAPHVAVRLGNTEALQAFEESRPGILNTCVNDKTLLQVLAEERLRDGKRFTDAQGDAVEDYLQSVNVGLECESEETAPADTSGRGSDTSG